MHRCSTAAYVAISNQYPRFYQYSINSWSPLAYLPYIDKQNDKYFKPYDKKDKEIKIK